MTASPQSANLKIGSTPAVSPPPSPSPWNIPNAISLVRIILAGVGLVAAWREQATAYRIIFAIAIFSDMLDGFLARWLKQQTELGARLDAIGDTLTYVVLAIAVALLWPEWMSTYWKWILLASTPYLLAQLIGVLRFHRLPAYHSWAGKITAVVIGSGVLVWFVFGTDALLLVSFVFVFLSGTESILITLLVPRWMANVPTFYHAWKLRAGRTM